MVSLILMATLFQDRCHSHISNARRCSVPSCALQTQSTKAGQYPEAADRKFCGVETHPLPLTILGSGRSGLANKFGCLVHVCKLEVSGSVSRAPMVMLRLLLGGEGWQVICYFFFLMDWVKDCAIEIFKSSVIIGQVSVFFISSQLL